MGKDVPFVWSEECNESFEMLKRSLLTPPVLAYPQLNSPFYLFCDSSTQALGYILSQKRDGFYHPVAFGGRNLKSCETRYTITELELLALIEGVKKYYQYLANQKFYINTDHRSLLYLNNFKNTSSRLMRWALQLEGFQFEVIYNEASKMQQADAISRIKHSESAEDLSEQSLDDRAYFDSQCSNESSKKQNVEHIFSDSRHIFDEPELEIDQNEYEITEITFIYENEPEIEAVITRAQKRKENEAVLDENLSLLKTLHDQGSQSNVTPNSQAGEDNQAVNSPLDISADHDTVNLNNEAKLQRMKEAQRKSGDFRFIIEYLENGMLPADENITLLIVSEASQYELFNGILYHMYQRRTKGKVKENEFCKQLALPEEFRQQIIGENHAFGHLGIARTYADIRAKYYFPRMYQTIHDFIVSCPDCQVSKRDTNFRHVPLRPMPSCGVFERYHVDILGHLPRVNDCTSMLVCIDWMSKYPDAFPLKTEKAEEIAEILYRDVFTKFGFPVSLFSDWGANFLSNIVQVLCKLLGVSKLQTSSYRPLGNGCCERVNQTILQCLRTYCYKNENDWIKVLPAVLMGLRKSVCTENSQYSPFELVFGKKMLLPLDTELLLPENLNPKASVYADKLIKRLKITREIALENTEQAQQRMKTNYDEKARPSEFKVGDLVYLKQNAVPVGKCRKIYRKWSLHPYYIAQVLKFDTYKLRSTVTNALLKVPVHKERLKLCKDPRDVRKPQEVLQPETHNKNENINNSNTPMQSTSHSDQNDTQAADKRWYPAQKLLKCRFIQGKKHYLVQWKGPFKPTWTEAKNVSEALIQDYYINLSKHRPRR